MSNQKNIVAMVNALVQAVCQEEGVKPFKTLSEEDVIKYAVRGVKHRMANYAYNKDKREKGKLFTKLLEAGVITQEMVDKMTGDDE